MESAPVLFSSFVFGTILLNTFLLVLTFIAVKSKLIRVSGASIIATLHCFWVSLLILVGLSMKLSIADNIKSGWIGGFVLLVFVVLYAFWLKIFEPQSIEQQISIDVIKRKIAVEAIEITELRNQRKKATHERKSEINEALGTKILNLKSLKSELRKAKKIKWLAK